jgi:hypothetical protein
MIGLIFLPICLLFVTQSPQAVFDRAVADFESAVK